MPVIKVWCLPADQTQKGLEQLHQNIVAAVEAVPELGLQGEKEMTCLFPPDLMHYGLGSEIIVEVSGLFAKPERTVAVKQRLARSLGEAVKNLYPNAKVECFVSTFNQHKDGLWSSDQLNSADISSSEITLTEGKKKLTPEDIEVIRKRLIDINPNEYERVRNEITQERGLTANQIGAVLVHLRYKRY